MRSCPRVDPHAEFLHGLSDKFLVRGPGIKRGRSRALVSHVDLMPTPLEFAGADPEAGQALEGRSMVAGLRTGNGSRWRDRLYIENPHVGWSMLRKGHLAFIHLRTQEHRAVQPEARPVPAACSFPTRLPPSTFPRHRTDLHHGHVGSTSKPIVVGYDGSPDADLALDWAARTATVTPSPLEVVIVGTHMDPVVGHLRERNDRLVDEWHQRAYGRLGETGVTRWDVAVRRGPTVPVLLAAAASAELLVVGSRGHGLLFGSLSGSVSQHLARHATCPVVVVRPLRQPGAEQIIVGIDGSDGSRKALRFACSRASATGESVLAVHAFRAWSLPGRDQTPFLPTAGGAGEADRLLSEACEAVRVDFDQVNLTTMAVAAAADRLLLDLGTVSSLVVVGSRGRDAFAEMLLGSVAQEVLHRAECPVAVVR